MSIGSNIKKIREEKKLTQENIADMLNVSYQAVSSWERDEYRPDIDNLINLAKKLDVSLSSLVEDKINNLKTKDNIFNYEHMKTFIKTTAKNYNLDNTIKALDFAFNAHEGQKRKNSNVPYIYHPLNMACHAMAMNLIDDEIITCCLLHDVVEDCNIKLEELPFNDSIKEIIKLLTHDKDIKNNKEALNNYYKLISNNKKASLVKCIDRCNNITTMSFGLSRDKMIRMINETEDYYPLLLKSIKDINDYSNASWLLKYQIESMLDIYKRLL